MFKHILVPLDSSQLAEAALPPALELAACFDSKITLLRITRPPYITSDTSGSTYADLVLQLRDQAYKEATEYLKTHQNSLQRQGYKVESRVREGEPVAEVILDMAEELEVDTIVMSTHGRGGISRWVFGSVADRVLRHADVPVLLIRAKETPLNWTIPAKVAETQQ